MIRLLLEPVNLLILDEPTNHLDMKTKDILKQAIKDFNGTVIVVSHDRDFLDGLVEKVYEFGGGKVRECLGGIYEFLENKKIESLDELSLSSHIVKDNKKTPTQVIPEENVPKSKNGNMSYFEQREHDKLVRRAKRSWKVQKKRLAGSKRICAILKTVLQKVKAGMKYSRCMPLQTRHWKML